jgi:hypothetical protein
MIIIIIIITTIMPLALHTIALRDQTRSNSSLHLSSRFVSSRPRYCGKLQPSPRLPFLLPNPLPTRSRSLASTHQSHSIRCRSTLASTHGVSNPSGGSSATGATHVRMYVYACPFLVCSHGDIGTHGRHVLRAPRAMGPEIARPSSQAKAFISVFPWSDICIYRGNTTILDDPDYPRRP